MLAIPLDSTDSTNISKLYGKAPYFGLLDTQNGNFTVIPNEQKGAGPKSAPFLREKGVKSTIFYHMGEGVYKSFEKEQMSVYTSKHNLFSIDTIYQYFLLNKLTQVDKNNYKELLDPGESGSCTCGCEH